MGTRVPLGDQGAPQALRGPGPNLGDNEANLGDQGPNWGPGSPWGTRGPNLGDQENILFQGNRFEGGRLRGVQKGKWKV